MITVMTTDKVHGSNLPHKSYTSKTGTVFPKQMSGVWYCDMRYLHVMSGECLHTTDAQMHMYMHKHTHTHTQGDYNTKLTT